MILNQELLYVHKVRTASCLRNGLGYSRKFVFVESRASIWQLDGQWHAIADGCNHMHVYSGESGGDSTIIAWCYPGVLWESLQERSSCCAPDQAKSNWPALGVHCLLLEARASMNFCNGQCGPSGLLESHGQAWGLNMWFAFFYFQGLL